jgi:endonuclease/exonuclease/phosphatase family metal-dependent hydrolase
MRLHYSLLLLVVLLSSCSPKVNRQNDSPIVLRVMSYNIHHANPPSKSKEGTIDIDAIAKVIGQQNPDIVALQEVDVNTKRSGNMNQAVTLAQKLKMNFYFAKAIDHDGGDYGVAILSRFPITDPATYKLPKNMEPKAEQRVLAVGTLEVKKGVFIRFASTHLDAQRNDDNRILQVTEIKKIISNEKLPILIAGDLNAIPGSQTVNIFDAVFTRTCKDCGFTIPVVNPNKTIDHIAYKTGNNFSVTANEVIPETYASDHLPILSVLELK